MGYIREFNKEAYEATDSRCKKATVLMMQAKGYQTTHDPNKENFKGFDLEFYNPEKDCTIKIENEMRENFDTLKGYYPTIHVPIRKLDSPADYLLVWKEDLMEFILIENKYLKSSPIIDVKCRARYGRPSYMDKMIDVDKQFVQFFKKIKGKWRKNNF